MRICIYEDRATDMVAVKLLVASLLRNSPGLDIEVTIPNPSESVRAWFSARPGARLRSDHDTRRSGYNVKGAVLARALEETEEALWIDSDIMVTRDLRPVFASAGPNTLAVSEEWFGAPFQGGTSRVRGLGLPVGRSLPATANTSVLKVTRAHRELLAAWDEILRSEEYLAAQGRVWTERPIWLLGDQEVLTGLLGSKRFADVPILWVRRGRDIAHCFPPVASGYAAHERVANIVRRRTPTFVHSIVERPWRPPNGQMTLHLETSPYTLTAAKYEADVEEPLPWTRPTLPAARLLRSLSADGTNASGLLPAIGWELKDQRILKTLVKRLIGKD
jgi:hypothetical protein